MNLLTITAVFFTITGLLHIGMLLRFGNNAGTRPVAAFGVVYLILSVLIWMGTFSWVPVAALIVTAVGGIGAITQLRANPELRSWTLFFIAIDVVIILLLIANFFVV